MSFYKRFSLKENKGYYMPLFNTLGMKASITPLLAGDLKIDQHHYALEPTTEMDLYHPIFSRNVIFDVNEKMYFLNGQTHHQQEEIVDVEMGFLYQIVSRSNDLFNIKTTSFVPQDDTAELHEIIFENISSKPLELRVITATPIYARSADNLRDHRHVTSLLNQISTVDHGIMVKPTLSFDERGHQVNHHIYSLFADSKNLEVEGYIPTVDDFISGGSLLFPKGTQNLSPKDIQVNGYEAMGGIAFKEVSVQPKEAIKLYISIGIHQDEKSSLNSFKQLNEESFYQKLDQTKSVFESFVSSLSFNYVNQDISDTLKWVVLQPMLRRYFGNSYMPHHDYGHGGRGWRDLWQDLLSLIMMNDSSVKDLLFNNFQGVRIDGSNATIIGDQPGEFKADRNMITRVWSDHGAWPLLTVKMYIDETGDIDFLLKKQYYFKDQFTHYTKKTRLLDKNRVEFDQQGIPYQGTILEHLLLQNLVGYHNKGQHGFTRLEDADWNDGLDMAHDQGETIAFTHMYVNNLKELSNMIDHMQDFHIDLFEDLLMLLEPNVNLKQYFDKVSSFEGKIVTVTREELIEKLDHLYELGIHHLHENAFKENHYQSYFNNDGMDPDLDGSMSLTGQAIALLSQTPSINQAKLIAVKTKESLFDSKIGGYKLNSNYQKILTNMGRAYGFAYGHKENGAVFSHMVMMYAYGLYQYNLEKEGREAYMTLLNRAIHHESHVPLGIPEYFTEKGLGKYMFLTGSASWMIKLLRTEVFGIQMQYGKLNLKPKLSKDDFIDGIASINTYIHGKLIKITYHNPKQLDFNQYEVDRVMVGGIRFNQPITSIHQDIEVYLDEIR